MGLWQSQNKKVNWKRKLGGFGGWFAQHFSFLARVSQFSIGALSSAEPCELTLCSKDGTWPRFGILEQHIFLVLWWVWTEHLTQSEVIRADPVIFAGALGNEAYKFSLFLNLAEYKPESSGVYQVQMAYLRGKAEQKKKWSQNGRKFPDAIISGLGPRWAQRNSSSCSF